MDMRSGAGVISFLGCVMCLAIHVHGATTVWEKTFSANQDHQWNKNLSFAQDGRLVVTMDNPDASLDGYVRFYDPGGDYLVHNFMQFGYYEGNYHSPRFFPNRGLVQSIYEFDIPAGASDNFGLEYLHRSGTDPDDNTVRIDYHTDTTLAAMDKDYVGRFVGPRDDMNYEKDFTVTMATAGRLVINTISAGEGGGDLTIELNGDMYAGITIGYLNVPTWWAVWIPQGTHTLTFSQNDGYLRDNLHDRTVDIYTVDFADQMIPAPLAGVVGLCALASLRLRRAH